MRGLRAQLSKLRIEELAKNFFINCGILFVGLNLLNAFGWAEVEPFGGSVGQSLFALVIAFSSTYFSKRSDTNCS